MLTREEMNIYWKYVGNLRWLLCNSRPDIVIVMNLARKQKGAALKDLRDMNRVLKKVEEEN